MASTNTLASRRHAAQLHGLACVEREVRSNDHTGRRKYLQDFSQAFCRYDAILDSTQLANTIQSADTLLVGDYHALPTSQRFAASLIEQRAQPGDRPVVLGVEAIFSRHQHILDEWWRREIVEDELRHRIRFDLDWSYDWSPFYELLVTAREHGDAIYALDCLPREDLRKIGARDRHAADKLVEIRQRHPNAVILVLFGESHLAPGHLPRCLRERLPGERMLTVLQNIDALYWAVTAEQERVQAVRISDDTVCVFNATPLEKYESYRLCLSRWQREDESQADLNPTVFNLIDSLMRFLDLKCYASHNGTQPRFLLDLLPEIYSGTSDPRLQQLLLRALHDPVKVENTLQRVESQGCVYLPSINVLYVREFQMMYAAEEVARFLHHACRGLPLRRNGRAPIANARIDRFYARTIEHALASFGSRILYPARTSENEEEAAFSLRICQQAAADALHGDRASFDSVTRKLGYTIGNQLYDAYLRGSVSRTVLRHLFLANIDEPGKAHEVCREILRKIRSTQKKPCASVPG